jgi:hypothetical protein
LRLAVLIGTVALAFAADHPQLTGTWRSDDAADTVTIQQTADSIQITETVHDKQNEFQCNTSGKSCKVKGGEVTFWYSGPMLVMMESLHGASRVIEKRWTASSDGKALNVEVIHIAPAANAEKIAYKRGNGS